MCELSVICSNAGYIYIQREKNQPVETTSSLANNPLILVANEVMLWLMYCSNTLYTEQRNEVL